MTKFNANGLMFRQFQSQALPSIKTRKILVDSYLLPKIHSTRLITFLLAPFRNPHSCFSVVPFDIKKKLFREHFWLHDSYENVFNSRWDYRTSEHQSYWFNSSTLFIDLAAWLGKGCNKADRKLS